MILAIDFDGVLHDPDKVFKGQKMGVPVDGAVQAMKILYKQHFLIIHTTRATTDKSIEAVHKWLRYFDIPFGRITSTKPDADYYIDNKAIAFTNWNQPEIERLKGLSNGK